MIKKTDPLVVLPDYPFLSDIKNIIRNRSGVSTTETVMEGDVQRKRITLIYEQETLRVPYVRLFQNKDAFQHLDPWACQIIVYIALNIGYQKTKIEMTPALVGISRERFQKSILDLILRRIIQKEKRKWYWVNVSLIIVGNLDHKQPQHEEAKNRKAKGRSAQQQGTGLHQDREDDPSVPQHGDR